MRLVRASAAASRIALASVSAAVLVSACHVPFTGGAGPAASGGGSITVAVIPGIDNAPLRVAVQDGLFQQHGLNVTVKGYSTVSSEIQALKSGQADVAVGDYTDFFAAQASGGAKLRLIADGYDAVASTTAVLTLPGSGITTPQSLSPPNGQPVRVATPPEDVPASTYPQNVPWNLPMMATQQVLQSDGVSPSSVDWRAMPMQDMIAALRSGRVKAILVTEPYIFRAEAQLGAVEVLDSDSGVTASLPLSGYFSSKSFTDSQPSTVRAFQAALSQAQGSAGMRGPVQNVLPSLTQLTTHMTPQDAAMITLGTYPTAVSVGQVQRVVTLMSDSGMISNPIDVSSLLFR
jgi:NitT/TauT family transport system substrate-binding protein